MKKDEQYKFFMEECQGCFLELDSQPIVTFILFDIQTELRLSNIEIVVNNSLSLETNFAKCRQLLLDLSEAQGIEKFVCFRTSVDMNKPIESLEAMEFSRQGVLSEQVFFCNRYHDLEIWQWHRPKERLETRLEDLSDPGAKL